MTQQTPGPWSTYVNTQDHVVIRKMFEDGTESHQIALCTTGFANAALIAAAPETAAERDRLREINAELVAVVGHCESLLMTYEIDRINGHEIADGALELIRAALAKAKEGKA